MNRKAVYGILLAVLLPVLGYIYVKKYSDRDVVMPHHYLPDSVTNVTRNGKQYEDTAWHRVPDFNLTNQLGQQISWKDMKGKIVVANFFFTHCPNICPNMTRGMKLLQDVIKSPEKVGDRDPNFVQFLSFTIDPARDSVTQLKKWNDLFQINPQEWWLLTGDRKKIYDLSINDLKMMAMDGGITDSNFVHTDMFVLIDTNRYVRGYYHVLLPGPNHAIDTAALFRLSQDVVLLSLEKDPKRKFLLADKLVLIITIFIITAVAVFILLVLLKRDKRKI
jgi:protein SCO1/2